jgi:hypothetical protein
MMIYIIDVLLYVILQLNEIKSQLSPAGENKGKQRSEKKIERSAISSQQHRYNLPHVKVSSDVKRLKTLRSPMHICQTVCYYTLHIKNSATPYENQINKSKFFAKIYQKMY